MKGKKILSCLLSAALCLPASAMPALAASFPDIANHWAVQFIDDTVKKGIFVGIDGKFVADKNITVSEVLATCARIGVDSETRTEIGADRAEQIKNLMGTNQDYFHKEYAVCLEAGILTYPELKELYQSGALLRAATKEDFAFYLVRAMQLEAMAKNLPSYSLDFTDKKDITSDREPYIYVLNMYGIITGTDAGSFQPKSSVNRAVAATMLSRATDFMEENGTSVELPAYTDYAWQAGTIVSAAAGSKGVVVLTLANELSGTKTVSLPAATPIYQNSMLVDQSFLKAGIYARVNVDSSGAVIDVRLSGSVQTQTGSVVGVSEEAVMLNVNGTSTTLAYDRFTEVKVGSKVGDSTLIDLDAGYTNAVCRVDQLGNMVAMQLTGGTRREEGLITSVENAASGGIVIVVAGFDGQLQRFTVPSGAAVTSNGLAVAALNSSYVGSYVSIRISNDNGSHITTAAVDTATKYVQGAIKSATVEQGANTVTITNLSTNKATTYKAATGAAYAYQGGTVAYTGLQKDWFVTARISSAGELTELWAYPGSNITEGTISGISFPSNTTKQVISVTRTDGSVASFEFDLAGTLPEVKRGGKTSSMDKLRGGDVVRVTVRYNAVTQIDATPQSANLAGVISELSQTTSGVTIKVTLDGGAGTGTYAIGSDVSVTQNGKTISMYDLRVGQHIGMVSSGDQVASVDVDKSTSTNNQIAGTIIYVNTEDKTILVRVSESGGADKVVTVSVPSGTTIQDVSGGGISNVTLSKLATGDTLDIYGSYGNDQFKATLVIRK